MKKNEILAIIIKRITENKNTYDDKFNTSVNFYR